MLKGVWVLCIVDVILYDVLIDIWLFNYVCFEVFCIFVGKWVGVYCMLQEEINVLFVKLVKIYGYVVWLKGGDVFVFGWGKEEIVYVQE